MKPSAPNPFHFGKAVAGENFCRRPQLEGTLRDRILAGQNVLVQGDRRVGKTSLIRRVAQSIRGYREIYVDLYGTRSTEAVVRALAQSVAGVERTAQWGTLVGKALSFVSVSYQRGGFSLGFNAPAKLSLTSIDELFDFLQRTRQGKWIVVIDEFQDVLKIEDPAERDALIAHLRSRVQFLAHTPFVFAGSARNLMHGIFHHPQSPFFKAAATLEVGPIDRADFSGWLCARFAAGGRRVNDETLAQIYDLAMDVPGDVQQFCAAIWEVTPRGGVFGGEDIPRALERIWEQEQRSNEAIVEAATPFQLRCLLTLAASPGTTPTSGEFLARLGVRALGPSVLKALGKFGNDGVLAKRGPHFEFVNPYFREWLKQRFPR